MNEPKTIDLKIGGSFKANGNTYYITDKISQRRWKEYEKLSPKLTYGIGFEEMFRTLGQAYEALNKMRFTDASVLIHNLMAGVKNVNEEKRIHPSLLMCALVINKEGEDTGIYDEQIQLDKTNDWQTEGYDVIPFFAFALKSINGFREAYLVSIQAQAKKAEKQLNKK